MPINMADLYAVNQGAATVEPGTGFVSEQPPIQTVDAEVSLATATGIDASQAGPAAQGLSGTAAPGVNEAAGNLLAGAASAAEGVAASGAASDPIATTATVDPSATVQQQLTDITKRASPLMERARMAGILSANKRGLLNTSIAAGAAEGAMVDRALPIAQQDAATYFSQQRANQDAQNVAELQRAGQETDISARNAAMQTDISARNAAAQTEVSQTNAALETQAAMAGLDATTQAALQEAMLYTDVQKFNADQRNNILALNAQLKQDASKFTAEEQNRISALNAQAETEISARNAAAKNEASFQDASLRAQLEDANASRELALAQGNVQEANRHTEFILDMNNDLNKQYLAGEQAISLATIQGRFNVLISSNESAAAMYESYFTAASNIMANDGMTPAAIATQVNVLQRQLTAGLTLIAETSNIDWVSFPPPAYGPGNPAPPVEPTPPADEAPPIPPPPTEPTPTPTPTPPADENLPWPGYPDIPTFPFGPFGGLSSI